MIESNRAEPAPAVGRGLFDVTAAASGQRQGMDNGTRGELLNRLAEAIGSVTVPHPTRVAIDGPPAAGKTTLGDELAVVLRALGRDVIRASIEGFLLPRAQRYRRGEYSAEGCYHDSFDFDSLHRVLLDPLGRHGDRRFRQGVYDRFTDTVSPQPLTTASAKAVLLFDGVFLLRPELIGCWDLRLFVSTGFDEALVRAQARDLALFGSTAEVERRHRERYGPSQQFYYDTVHPSDLADIIVQNANPLKPAWQVKSR